MKSRRSSNKEIKDRLSTFEQRLQSLSDTFYSTILEDSKEKKIGIKNAKELEHTTNHDFTFDECSTSEITSNDNFSFTFHSFDQSNNKEKCQRRRINHSSTPYSIRGEHLIKKREEEEEETIMLSENRSPSQPIIIGYYPVISYQPLCLPPPIYFSKEQIQSEINHFSTLTKVTPMKKT